jgi:outer membrane protein OmpA-like peptidoglycan-associated protein
MKGAAQRWIVASVAGVVFCGALGNANAQTYDTGRLFLNYTRETATVPDGQLRVEIRGFTGGKGGQAVLNSDGFVQPVTSTVDANGNGTITTPDEMSLGQLQLLASYGITKNIEAGFIIPGMWQGLTPTVQTLQNGVVTKTVQGPATDTSDIGDFELYGKFQHNIWEHLDGGGGVELTMGNGPSSKGLGAGAFGANPFVSLRWQQGAWGIGAHTGYFFYGASTPNVFNYSLEGFLRVTPAWSLRVEWSGRNFVQGGGNPIFGSRIWDSLVAPGIDVNILDNLTIRPTGIVGTTPTSTMDWGIGAGLAYTFTPALPVVAQAPPPPPPPPAPAPAPKKIVLRGVHFDFNKSTIRPDAKPVLDEAIATLKEEGGIAVIAEGYTDSIGSDAYNMALSIRRADAVRDYLVAGGIAASRVSAEGFGKTNPVASNDTEDGRAQNRRVELRIRGN